MVQELEGPAKQFGKKSAAEWETLHRDLQLILNIVVEYIDFAIIQGARTVAEQQRLFKLGKSELDGITQLSKHNVTEKRPKSMAVDLLPYKRGTNAFSGKVKDNARFYHLMGAIHVISELLFKMGEITHKVRFGIDWNRNMIFDDQSFDDMPHMELIDAV
jgi:peptidoglycan L-alanyl-D-glutamate endopeptidase CwlK